MHSLANTEYLNKNLIEQAFLYSNIKAICMNLQNACFSLFFSCISRGVIRIQSNICDGAFLRNHQRLLVFNYFRKKTPSKKLHVRLGSKYASEFEHHFQKSKNCFATSTEIQTIRELSSLHLNAKAYSV